MKLLVALALLAFGGAAARAEAGAFEQAVESGVEQAQGFQKVFYSQDGRRVINSAASPYRMVGHLVLDGRQICTAFLVGEDVAMTARHCVETAMSDKHVYTFKFDGGGPWRDSSRHQWDEVDVVEIVRAVGGPLAPDTDLDGKPFYPKDWALLKLQCPDPAKGCPDPRTWGYLSLASRIAQGESTITVGFPDPFLGYKVLAGGCSARKLYKDTIYSDCSLDKGASGSPLLVKGEDGQWEVAGVFSNIGTLQDGYPPMGEPYGDAIANHFTNITLDRSEILRQISELEGPASAQLPSDSRAWPSTPSQRHQSGWGMPSRQPDLSSSVLTQQG